MNFVRTVSLTAGLTTMPNIVVELHDGSLGPIELQTPPEKTAAAVLDASSTGGWVAFHQRTTPNCF